MSSTNLGRNGLLATATRYITPECSNLSKSIKMSSMFSLILIILTLILLIAAIVYNYVKKTPVGSSVDASKDEDNKKKVIGGLVITSTVISALAAAISAWSFGIVGKAANTCISS